MAPSAPPRDGLLGAARAGSSSTDALSSASLCGPVSQRLDPSAAINASLQKGRKSTQRERVLDAMIRVAGREGYARATVSAVISLAGVSRPTFYEYFADRDECFLAAVAHSQQQLSAAVLKATGEQPPEHACQAAVEAMVSFAASQPMLARLLMSEAMAGGPRGCEKRDQGVREIADIVEARRIGLPADALVADLESGTLIGGAYRLLATRLRRGEPGMSALTKDLAAWVRSYERPLGECRWHELQCKGVLAPSPVVPSTELHAPMALPPGRPRLSDEDVAWNHRMRIMFAAACLAQEKGYTATTVADITGLAGVDGRAFYRLFADKQDAFMAVHELGFQQVMEITARGFFSGDSWPQRSWEAGRALTQLLERNPLVAHVGFVEAYAVGRNAAQRVEDSHIAFTIFLQEGFQHQQGPERLPRLTLEAIIATIFETIYQQARSGASSRVSGLLPHIAHLWLAPFLGPAAADRLIDEMQAAEPRETVA
jgi:AcrR family transcriptional regulator